MHNKSQAPEDGCTNIWNMLSSKWWNNEASDIKLVYFYSTIKNGFFVVEHSSDLSDQSWKFLTSVHFTV